MFNRPSKNSSFARNDYEVLLREGITAAKNGRRGLARRLLGRATVERPADARPWLWLSATTDEIDEQKQLLEKAVTLDPTNSAARKRLAELKIQLGEVKDISPGTTIDPNEPIEHPLAPVQAESESFLCPKCGGKMHFDVDHQNMVCDYCGYIHETGDRIAAGEAEQGLDFVMYTEHGHDWAKAKQKVACERCGAVSLLDATSKTTHCLYCGSNQLVKSEEIGKLIEPQVIAPFKVGKKDAHEKARGWLDDGWLAPADLVKSSKNLRLRAAYYPFWTFDGTLEANWSCEVRVNYGGGSGSQIEWEYRSGVLHKFFDDVLVPGVKAVSLKEVKSIEPYAMKELVAFEPEYLAGWPTLHYDRSMADASLVAREIVMRAFRRESRHKIEPSKEKRNVSLSPGHWSGMSFKHVLLPIWVGTYTYQGEEFHVLVNGQTGAVGGSKPQDKIKLYLFWGLIGAVVLGVAVILVILLTNYFSDILAL